MSILIKGMEMPKNCRACPFEHIAISYCNVIKKSTSHYPSGKEILTPRHKDCPLVEIPPHGRLIDADALQKDIQKHADLFVNCGNLDLAAMAQRDGLSCALSDVVNAPTIIEAEEGE